MKRLLTSFQHAFCGLGHALRGQPNARIHLAISAAVVGLGLWLGLDRLEWSVVVVAAGTVWTAELINTALEAIVDLASPEHRPLARVAKDVSAAAVLLAALAAAAAGALLLGPRILERLD